jgi:hypothetical protein
MYALGLRLGMANTLTIAQVTLSLSELLRRQILRFAVRFSNGI